MEKKISFNDHPGRGKLFAKPEELEDSVNEYFELCKNDNKPPTMSGLGLHLGFSSRASLLNYRVAPGYEDFAPIIKDAKMRVESYTEEKLITDKSVHGKMFSLSNNFGWASKQEIITRMEDDGIDYSKLSAEALREIAQAKQDGKQD